MVLPRHVLRSGRDGRLDELDEGDDGVRDTSEGFRGALGEVISLEQVFM
jgi:hypothetical protein